VWGAHDDDPSIDGCRAARARRASAIPHRGLDVHPDWERATRAALSTLVTRALGFGQHHRCSGRSSMATQPAQPRFLTVAEVAEQMRVSNMTVYRILHSGELPAIRVGRSFRVPAEALEKYLATNVVGREGEDRVG